MKRSLNLIPILFIVLFLLALYPPFSNRTRPNVLLITIDTLRQDHCSTYGYQLDTTPFMEQIAREGTRFEKAYSTIATTLPSHTTLFTSLYPLSHGILKNGFILAPEHKTMAEIFQDQGYATAAYVSCFPVNGKFGLKQGFQTYSDDFSGDLFKVFHKEFKSRNTEPIPIDRRGSSTAKKAIKWLSERQKDKPFFMWVHFYDPHDPYLPLEPYRKNFAPPPTADDLAKQIGLYDAEINFADRQMYGLFETLEQQGIAQNTLAIIAADHGEGLMQHNHMHHGLFLYEEAVRIPLIFRWPGKIPAGRVLPYPVQLVDLLPTVLDYTGITYADEKSFQGISLLPFINGNSTLDPNRPLFFQRRLYGSGNHDGQDVKGEKFAIQQGDWKYIEALEEGTHELYNLKNDPAELKDIYDTYPDKGKQLSTQLEEWKKTHRRSIAVKQVINEQDLENLKALGYVQ